MTSKEYYRNYRKLNADKLRTYHHNWKKNNPDKVKINQKHYDTSTTNHRKITKRRWKLKKAFNISIEEYDAIFHKQNGNCAICDKNQSEFKIRLAVDHNHQTGEIRGLLCFGCNTAIGRLNDDFQLCLNAYNYLKPKE